MFFLSARVIDNFPSSPFTVIVMPADPLLVESLCCVLSAEEAVSAEPEVSEEILSEHAAKTGSASTAEIIRANSFLCIIKFLSV